MKKEKKKEEKRSGLRERKKKVKMDVGEKMGKRNWGSEKQTTKCI